MPNVTPELVNRAYEALASGNLEQIKQYWAEEMKWLVPGHNTVSGWYHGRDEYLSFMDQVNKLSGSSFNMKRSVILTNDEYSADVSHNVGTRAGSDGKEDDDYQRLTIDVVHVLRWRDGKVIEGRGAIFGDGTTNFDQFWSPVGVGNRNKVEVTVPG